MGNLKSVILPTGTVATIKARARIHEAADFQRNFPEWTEPLVVDEDHLERSRIVCAWLSNNGQKSGVGRHTDAAGDSVPDSCTSLTTLNFFRRSVSKRMKLVTQFS